MDARQGAAGDPDFRTPFSTPFRTPRPRRRPKSLAKHRFFRRASAFGCPYEEAYECWLQVRFVDFQGFFGRPVWSTSVRSHPLPSVSATISLTISQNAYSTKIPLVLVPHFHHILACRAREATNVAQCALTVEDRPEKWEEPVRLRPVGAAVRERPLDACDGRRRSCARCCREQGSRADRHRPDGAASTAR